MQRQQNQMNKESHRIFIDIHGTLIWNQMCMNHGSMFWPPFFIVDNIVAFLSLSSGSLNVRYSTVGLHRMYVAK